MSNEIYYLKPDFKLHALIVPFIILVPSIFIICHIVKGDTENFENKDLENAIINKEKKIIETDEKDDVDYWDVTEYLKDKYNELNKYLKKTSAVNNDNGNKSINIRYKI